MEPKNAIAHVLPHVANMWERRADQLLQEQFGVGVAQHKILVLLAAEPGLGQAQLARHLGQTEASVSRQVRLLAERGLLASKINTRNRRQHLAILTAKGAHIVEAAEAALAKSTDLLLVQLSPKQHKQFAELLAGLHASICVPGARTACDHQPVQKT